MSNDQGTAAEEIDTANDCFVGTSAGDIVFPLIGALSGRIPPDKALRLAAWIVAMADDSAGHERFLAVLGAVENT